MSFLLIVLRYCLNAQQKAGGVPSFTKNLNNASRHHSCYETIIIFLVGAINEIPVIQALAVLQQFSQQKCWQVFHFNEVM